MILLNAVGRLALAPDSVNCGYWHPVSEVDVPAHSPLHPDDQFRFATRASLLLEIPLSDGLSEQHSEYCWER